jgi:hypothetical protein
MSAALDAARRQDEPHHHFTTAIEDRHPGEYLHH